MFYTYSGVHVGHLSIINFKSEDFNFWGVVRKWARAASGHIGNAEERHGKSLPWKVAFLKGITAMAEGIDGNCRRVISGLMFYFYIF